MRKLILTLLCLATSNVSTEASAAAGMGPVTVGVAAKVTHLEGQNRATAQTVGQVIDLNDVQDVYARLDDRNTAFQSVAGINAVRVGGVFWNGLPFNEIRSSTTYDLRGTFFADDDRSHDLYMDFLVFPGVVGLSRYASPDATATVELTVTSNLSSPLTAPVGAHAALTLNGGTASGLPTVTADPIFETQPGTHTIDGFTLVAIETRPIFGTAYLGRARDGETVIASYLMTATVRMPGYEIGGVAMLGDPFALRTDSAAEMAEHFPGAAVPFQFRAVAAVPEPSAGLLGAIGLSVVAITAWRRRSMSLQAVHSR